MKKKHTKKDSLVARLTADRVLHGKGSKNQFLHLRSLMQGLNVERDETLEEKDDSVEEGGNNG